LIKTLVVDGDSIFKIGLHGITNQIYKNKHIGAIYYFLTSVKKRLETSNYDKVVVFWDGEDNSIQRKNIYPNYKSNRKNLLTPEQEENKFYQRNRIKQYLEETYIRQGQFNECESDDCIAYYCHSTPQEIKTIMSGDKDLSQLISPTVNYYMPRLAKLLNDGDMIKMHEITVPVKNVKTVKILCGDSSDVITGIQSLGEKTLLKFFPEIVEREISVDYIKTRAEQLLIENKDNKVIQNLLSGKTKHGIFGEEYFIMNDKLINLENPLLTEEAKNEILTIINDKIDPEGRGWKNLIKMMTEDGLFHFLPQNDNAWTGFFTPYLKLARKETKKI